MSKYAVSERMCVGMRKRIVAFLMAVVSVCALLTSFAGASGKKLIALTFDDGPGRYTEGLLDGLKERDVKVTFFMQGINAELYPSIVKRAYNEGHQIANHTYNHPQLTSLDDNEVAQQVKRTNQILTDAIGIKNRYLLRPPYGAYNKRVMGAAGTAGILWSVDPQDWKDRNSDIVYKRIINNAYDGAVILVHDIHSTTIPGALKAIDYLEEHGYEFVTVEEILFD